jgi:hypothetical protein
MMRGIDKQALDAVGIVILPERLTDKSLRQSIDLTLMTNEIKLAPVLPWQMPPRVDIVPS